MTQAPIQVLLVDDDEGAGGLVAVFLNAHGYAVEVVASGQAALARLAAQPPPDVVLLDIAMPDLDGLGTLRHYKRAEGQVPVVMVSAVDEPHTVVQAMRLGAADYITKPINHDELLETLRRVVDLHPLRASTSTSVLSGAALPAGSLGVSPAMRRVEALLERVADADVPILLTGESGVGKDVVARELHARSARRSRVFVKINCAALPENLLESELFGYERGAFTGAQRAKPGQFELANGGTLFLDEIGEMPASLQAKLLQALQDGEFYRVGGQKKVRVDVRIIVATNRDLEKEIREGRFREDLYYRLNVVHLRIPPLRERREDIPGLLATFVDRYGRRYGRSAADVPPDVVARFLTYDWPGNVRELENLVRRLMVLRDPSYVYSEMRPSQGSLAGAAKEAAAAVSATAIAAAAPPAPSTPPGFPVLPAEAALSPTPRGNALASARISRPAAEALPVPASVGGASAARAEAWPPVPARNVVDFPSTAGFQHRGAPVAAPPPAPLAPPARGGSYPFGGYASGAAARPLGEVVAEEFSAAGADGRVDLKALGRKAAEIAEREAIVAMLARTGGSKREAADRLGISYKAILYKVREFGIGRPRVPRKPVPATPKVVSPVVDEDLETDDEDDEDDSPALPESADR